MMLCPYQRPLQHSNTFIATKCCSAESWRWPGSGGSKASLVTLEQSILPGMAA